MKITITAEMCRKYDYMENRDCPLFHALKERGILVESIGGNTVTLQGGNVYLFDSKFSTGWNSGRQHDFAKANTDFILDIPGLELEVTT